MTPSASRVAARFVKETPDLELMGDALDDLMFDNLVVAEIGVLLDYAKRARNADDRLRAGLLNLLAGRSVQLIAWMERNETDAALKGLMARHLQSLQRLARNPYPEKFTPGE
jgi:hypothetical protein